MTFLGIFLVTWAIGSVLVKSEDPQMDWAGAILAGEFLAVGVTFLTVIAKVEFFREVTN